MNRSEAGISEINKTARELAASCGVDYKKTRKRLIARAKHFFENLEQKTHKDGNKLGLSKMLLKAPKVFIGDPREIK